MQFLKFSQRTIDLGCNSAGDFSRCIYGRDQGLSAGSAGELHGGDRRFQMIRT